MHDPKTKVKIFVGPGGVGKTTLSSAYALKESKANPDKKYKLITIDPSKRLRDVFSMSFEEKEKTVSDNLTVSLNQREVLFKEFLESSLTEDGLLEDFYRSSILKSLLEDLAISQEFTTFYELVTSVASKKYDVIVIDTPPLQNTADFMTSVNKLEALFSSKILALFLAGDKSKGFLYKMIHASRQVSFKLLKTLTGEDFVDELEIFFKVTDLLRLKILDVVRSSRSILKDSSSFYLVCNHTELSLRALNLSLWSLKKNKVLFLEKAYINKFNANATKPVNKALAVVKESVQIEPIHKTSMDLNNLNNLEKLLKTNMDSLK